MAVKNESESFDEFLLGALKRIEERQLEAEKREAKRDEDQTIRDGVLETCREILTTMDAGIRDIVAATAQADAKTPTEDRIAKVLDILQNLHTKTARTTIALLDQPEKDEGSP
jgi:hypothetical protein